MNIPTIPIQVAAAEWDDEMNRDLALSIWVAERGGQVINRDWMSGWVTGSMTRYLFADPFDKGCPPDRHVLAVIAVSVDVGMSKIDELRAIAVEAQEAPE